MTDFDYSIFPDFHDKVLFPTPWSKAIWEHLDEDERFTVYVHYSYTFRYFLWKIFRIFKLYKSCKQDIKEL